MFNSLIEYLDSIRARDPAPRSRWEILLYPGVLALGLHRVAHWLYGGGLFFLARLVNHIARGLTAIDRLEYSAMAEDQLLAVALRSSAGPADSETVAAVLACLFATPPMRVAVEAQRHAAFGPFAGAGLPIKRAWEAGTEISRRARQQESEVYQVLLNKEWVEAYCFIRAMAKDTACKRKEKKP